MRVVNIAGATFHRLTAVRRVPPPNKAMCQQYRDSAWWEFSCACGKTGVVRQGINVRRGLTRSCGCLVGDVNRANAPARGIARTSARLMCAVAP